MTSVPLRACLSGRTGAGNKSSRRQHPSGSPERGRPRKARAPIPATRLTSNASWRSASRTSIGLSSRRISLGWSETHATELPPFFARAAPLRIGSSYLENRRTGRVDFESLAANDIKVRVYENTAARSGYSPTPRCYGTPRRPLILPRRSHQTH